MVHSVLPALLKNLPSNHFVVHGDNLQIYDGVGGATGLLSDKVNALSPHATLENSSARSSRRWKSGLKWTGALCGVAAAALIIGWMLDELWYRDRVMGYGLYGGGLYGGML